MNNRKLTGGALTRRNALTVALAVGLGFTGVALGQATTGAIFGTAPSAAGQTVRVTGAGVSRTVSVNQNGRYTVSNLPVGTYTVTLNDNGNVVSTHQNVSIAVGSGTEVDFNTEANASDLSAVQVRANALPSIDVTSVNSSTIITADDLQKLPIGRNAESIALLSPGTVQGSGYFGNAVSFGGSSVSENAYYVNGYNTGEPYRNIGGFQLPYGAIAQQETLSGGFSAKYGRSDGGVISQIGKRGTNEWHFGGQIVWQPKFLSAAPRNLYMPTQNLPTGTFTDSSGNPQTFRHAAGYSPGLLNRYRNDNKTWETVYSAYVGGPLIKDKLYIFVAAESTKDKGSSVSSRATHEQMFYSNQKSNYYGKVDWNIDDNNIFEATFLKSTSNDGEVGVVSGPGATYNFDYNSLTSGKFVRPNDKFEDDAKFVIGHYTSYISDNATLSIMYGKGSFKNPATYGYNGDLPYIQSAYNQNPAFWPAGTDPTVGIINQQNNETHIAKGAEQRTKGLRVDFNYILGDHNLGVGIDNMTYVAKDQGEFPAGPGYWWQYSSSGLVYQRVYQTLTNMSLRQRAYYLQDEWQVTSNLQLNLGLRNDRYTNYNDQGVAFVDEKNQWEPRLGFSWDVNGDSSLKIYGNAGRYYLALPNNAAERAANASTLTYNGYSYTGIDANGEPTGLTPVFTNYSPDGEFGQPKDPKQVTATNLRAMYVDQFNVGFDKKLGDKWVYGAKLGYRALKTTIDDECDPGSIATKIGKMGLDPNDYTDSLYGPAYCRLINPGQTSNLRVAKNDGTGYTIIPMSQADWGYLQKPKRTFATLNLYMEHPFDGTWYGRIDYTYTRARGNTAGQVRPDFGQADVSKTEDWDTWQLMDGADGELLNSRKHQIRIRGAYQLTPEWLLSGTALIQSGTPEECLGYYGTSADQDPSGYNQGVSGNYHWCAGQVVHPGKTHTPWTHIFNVGVRYTPAFADKKLSFKLDVFNLLNEQKATQTDPNFVNGPYVMSNFYHYPVSVEPPRYMRLSVSYDY